MSLLHEAKKGNRVLKIRFPSGDLITFRLLSWKDHCTYKELYLKKSIPEAILEDAVYRECVLDPYYIENIHDLYAGFVSTIVGLIMSMSGPADNPSVFNESLEVARQHVDTIGSQLLMTICRAFPAYKPEDLMNLPWHTVLIRAAQAERMLLSGGPTEPLRAVTREELEGIQKKQSGNIDVNKLVRSEASEMTAQGMIDRSFADPRVKENESSDPRNRLRMSPQQVELLHKAKALREKQATTGHF